MSVCKKSKLNRECKLSASHDFIYKNRSINTLPTECLSHIFSYIPVFDSIILKKVCTRWESVINTSLKYRAPMTKTLRLTYENYDINLIRKVLRIYGKNVIYIDFSVNGRNLDQLIFRDIAKFCTNVRSIDLSSVNVEPNKLKLLQPVLKNLIVLKIGASTNFCDIQLSHLLRQCKKLKSLQLSSTVVRGRFLIFLPECLEVLILQNITIKPGYLKKALGNPNWLKNLRTLYIDNVIGLNERSLATVIDAARNTLKNFSLSGYFDVLESASHISRLSGIEKLHLSNNELVYFTLLDDIRQNCTFVTHVDISHCPLINAECIKAITSLPELEYLNINYCQINDCGFSIMPNLRTLLCRTCFIPNENLINILRTSEKLETLDISYCDSVTSDFFDIAEQIVTTRTCKSKLEIICHGKNRILIENRRSSYFYIKILPEYYKTTIDDLNDNCLKKIFSYLPLVDKFNLDKVCKRWLSISTDIWTTPQSLDETITKRETLNDVMINKLLQYGSSNLHHVNFSVFGDRLNEKLLRYVAKRILYLDSIDVSSYKLTAKQMNILTLHYTKLCSLVLGACEAEKDLLTFLNSSSLNNIKIVSNEFFNIRYFEQLESLKYVKSIILHKCKNICIIELTKVIRNINYLKNLSITECEFINETSTLDVQNVTITSMTLKRLHLYKNSLELKIGKLPNLKIFDKTPDGRYIKSMVTTPLTPFANFFEYNI